MKNITVFIVLLLVGTLTLTACQTTTKVTNLSAGQTGPLSYPSIMEDFDIKGILILPEKVSGKVPAMIIAHGSGGRDVRGSKWGNWFRTAGIATMEIDYFGPRGIDKNSVHQPTPSTDINDAFMLLATHPNIDPDRIGAIGFSRGAGMVVIAGNWEASRMGGHEFAAVVALYPPCRWNSIAGGGSKTPVMVLIGTKDSYTSPAACERLKDNGIKNGREVKVIVYEGAYHAWDGYYTGTWYHRALKRYAEFKTDYEVTKKSRKDVLDFLKGPLKLN